MNLNPINEEVYEKTRIFVISALKQLLSSLQKGEKIPATRVETYKVETEGSWIIDHELQPIYLLFMEIHREEIEGLPEYEACVEAMRSDKIISKHLDSLVGTWNTRIRRTSWDYMRHILIKQLSQNREKIEFDLETFNRLYHDLEQFFYNDSFELRVIIPLHNFEGDINEIDLGEGLRIRKITLIEIEQLLNEVKEAYLQMSPWDIIDFKYVIELAYTAKKILGDPPETKPPSTEINVDELTKKLITALRLFKSGITGFNIIKTLSKLDVPGPRGMTFRSPYKKSWREKYILIETEVDELKQFWEWFNTIDLGQYPSLDVALRRFNYAYERERLDDRFIDYIVAFEALFFKQGEQGEFTHKLTVRTARLLKKTYEERKNLKAEMRDIYKERSRVIHGESRIINKVFVDKTEGYLRESIKLFLELLQDQTYAHDEIISHLDLDELSINSHK